MRKSELTREKQRLLWEEINSWYRGRKDSNGNWEYDCVSDSLEEAFECL